MKRFLAADPWPISWNPGVKPSALGSGSIHPFDWYFTRSSAVEVKSPEGVASWLRDCTYVDDREAFGKNDLWQHPCDFEQTRRGDCEDHALWAWRKLAELGLVTHFYVGLARFDERPARLHAWVNFTQNGREYLLEAATKSEERIIQPLETCKELYCPRFSVDSNFKIRSHRGYVWTCFGWKWSRA